MNKTELLPDRPGIPPMAKLPDPEVVDPAALAQAYYAGDIDLICVVGPTASGKTRYAVQLAKALAPAEIISADSRQVYTGMDIGTGKDLKEYGDVPYHLIDIVPAGGKFNIYQYQEAFAKAKGHIRSVLAKKLSWRTSPELRFFVDKTVDEAERIARALEVERSRSGVNASEESE